jgi:uncharacterized phage-like protein YoqJ
MIVAITGHRSEDCEAEEVVRGRLRDAFLAEKPTTVIVGMANGVDLWAGDISLSMGIDVIAAKPWAGHGPRTSDRELYARVLEGASKIVSVTDVQDYPGPWVYHKRNHWMVDHADLVIAYWSGKKSGGTYACIEYARDKKDVVNIYE